MGRYVYDSNGHCVWKYIFGKQPSEQSRIAEELDIGKVEYNEDGSGDVLTLTKEDAKKLRKYLNETIKIDFFDNKFKATRIECVKYWNGRYDNDDEGIRYDGFADNVNNLVNDLMNQDLNFWAMIYTYINHIEKLNCKWIEFYGEY